MKFKLFFFWKLFFVVVKKKVCVISESDLFNKIKNGFQHFSPTKCAFQLTAVNLI